MQIIGPFTLSHGRPCSARREKNPFWRPRSPCRECVYTCNIRFLDNLSSCSKRPALEGGTRGRCLEIRVISSCIPVRARTCHGSIRSVWCSVGTNHRRPRSSASARTRERRDHVACRREKKHDCACACTVREPRVPASTTCLARVGGPLPVPLGSRREGAGALE